MLAKKIKKGLAIISRPRVWLPLLLLLLLLITALFFVRNQTQLNATAAEESFVFTAAGDHGFDSNALAGMDAVASSSSRFYLALGDLSYQAGAEQNWCNTFKSKFNDVEVLAGNHDVGENAGGNIDNYIQHCPFTLPSLNGSYGKQYYFDYPQTGPPLARFIMIAPGVTGSLNGLYNYNAGGNGYIFTENAITEAKNQGVPWIVVGMHKNCISTGNKPCEIGTDIMNLLITKKVDLILQGHDHNYQRSHQLSCITTNTVNPSCIADSGTDGLYTKGNGPVIIINGEFGRPQYATSLNDTEAGYFAVLDSTTFGITKYTVTNSQISAQYLRSGGGGFADSFTIASSGATPTPTSTQTQAVLDPIADAYVDSALPNTNYGLTTNLYVDGSPFALTYLKFDLSALAGMTLTSAKLRIKTTTDPNAGSPHTQFVKVVDDTTWTETGITYTNKPAVGTQIGSIVGTAANTQYDIPLTTTALQPRVGGLLALAFDEIASDGLRFDSREAVGKPQLILTYDNSTTPTIPGPTAIPTVTPTPTPTNTPTPIPTSTPTPTAGGNLLINPSFESGISPWSLYVSSPAVGNLTRVTDTKVDGTYSAKVAITTSAPDAWRIQLRQSGLSLVAGKTYTVSFWAKASSNRQIIHTVQLLPAPNTIRGYKYFSITPTWQKFTYSFVASNTDTSTIFYGFNVGKNTGTVWIDSATFTSN